MDEPEESHVSDFGRKKATGVPREKRRASREALEVSATAVTTASRCTVTVTDISVGGAGLISPTPPKVGRDMQIRVAGYTLFGAVTWTSEDAFGVSFDKDLDVQASAKLDEATTASKSERVVAKRLSKDQ